MNDVVAVIIASVTVGLMLGLQLGLSLAKSPLPAGPVTPDTGDRPAGQPLALRAEPLQPPPVTEEHRRLLFALLDRLAPPPPPVRTLGNREVRTVTAPPDWEAGERHVDGRAREDDPVCYARDKQLAQERALGLLPAQSTFDRDLEIARKRKEEWNE